MSYGRDPFYIYECACEGTSDDMHGPSFGRRHVVFDCGTNVAWDALMQFIATAHWRGELPAMIDAGYQLRPELQRPPDCLKYQHRGPLAKPPRKRRS